MSRTTCSRPVRAIFRASQLSSSDWDGFETLWADRGANAAIQIKVDAFAEERDNAVREVIGDVSSLFHVESADATPGEVIVYPACFFSPCLSSSAAESVAVV